MAANRVDIGGDEDRLARDGLEQHRVFQLPSFAAIVGAERKPSISLRINARVRAGRGGPAPAIEICERDAAPVRAREARGISFDFHAHNHFAALLDFADLAELNTFAEACHQRGAHGIAGEISAGEARQQKENYRAKNDGAKRDAETCRRKRADDAARGGACGIKRRSDGAFGCAFEFEADRRGNAENDEEQKEREECCIYSEHCGREHRGEAEHREERDDRGASSRCRGATKSRAAKNESQRAAPRRARDSAQRRRARATR